MISLQFKGRKVYTKQVNPKVSVILEKDIKIALAKLSPILSSSPNGEIFFLFFFLFPLNLFYPPKIYFSQMIECITSY